MEKISAYTTPIGEGWAISVEFGQIGSDGEYYVHEEYKITKEQLDDVHNSIKGIIKQFGRINVGDFVISDDANQVAEVTFIFDDSGRKVMVSLT